ncbi:MAG: carboxypeptidase-like regulatory domain-containing protein, partial [bacterium]
GDPAAYQLDDGNAATSVKLQPGGRVALLNLARGIGAVPLSAVPARTLAIMGVSDPRGNPLQGAGVPVETNAEIGIALRGVVVAANGQPLEDVPVTLTMHDRRSSGLSGCNSFNVRVSQVRSDAEGRFVLDFVLAGVPYSVSATNTVGLPAEVVQLILDSASQDAVDRERLEALASSPSAQGTLLEAFAVGALPDAIALAEGLDRALLRDVVPLDSLRVGSEVPVALRFRGRGSVSGLVLANDGLTPVPGAAVNLFPDPDSRELGRGLLADSAGRFAFFGVPLGSYSVEAADSSGLRRTVSGALEEPGEADELEISLSANVVPRTTLRGNVVESDGVTPHAGARVLVGRLTGPRLENVIASVPADAEGFWRATEIPAGAWDLVAVSADGRTRGERNNVAATAGVESFVTLRLQGRTTVEVRVTFANGDPVPGALVGGGEVIVTTGPNGRVVVPGVPVGSRRLSAGLRGEPGSSDPRRQFTRTGSASVNVVPGVANFATIRLPAVGSLFGQVFDASGRPVPNVNVAIPATDSFQWTSADAQGRYRFDNLPLRAYTLSAPAPLAADTDVGGALDTLADPDASRDDVLAAIGDAFEVFTGVNDPFRNGEGLVFNPGSWGFSKTSLVSDGQSREVNIVFLSEGTVRGQVLNGQGVPIGARVRLTGVKPTSTGNVGFGIRGERNSDPATGTFEFVGQVLEG